MEYLFRFDDAMLCNKPMTQLLVHISSVSVLFGKRIKNQDVAIKDNSYSYQISWLPAE